MKNWIILWKSFLVWATGTVLGKMGRIIRFKPATVRLKCGAQWLLSNDYLSFCIGFGFYEKDEQLFFLNFIQKGWTIIDVGAHHGFFTLLFSRAAGSEGRVIAFEPSVRERERLSKHLFMNSCGNVTVEPFALSDRSGTTKLYVCEDVETGCNSLRIPHVFERVTAVDVTLLSLDQYCMEHAVRKIDLIKIDVEGGEWSVLKGGASVLTADSPPFMMIEIMDHRMEAWGYRGSDILHYLEKFNYSFFSFCHHGRLKPLHHKTKLNQNIFAAPARRIGELASFMVN